LAEYKKIILKPQRGNRGRGIYYIEDRNSYYLIIANKEKIELEKNKIDTFIENEITHKNYIVQRYIQSLTKDNLPFDIRIHVRRDINAEWKVVKIYPRIGTNDGITSNVSQGGYIGQIDKFLKRQFGDKYLTVHDELTKLAKEFPVYFQKGYNYNIDALGIDIGIDDNCKLWLFEVNSYPGSTFFELESQIVAMGYAKYLAQQEKQRHIIKT
jgi:glutathione synthase/RimK-type ligase-like ATP-grasp enzyme